MSFKTFYINIENQLFFEKKIITTLSNYKHFQRNSFKKNNIIQIDDNQSYNNILSNRKNTIGTSIYTKKFVYKHKFNKNLKINSFIKYSKHSNYITKKLTNYKFFKNQNLNILKYIYLYKPIKAGYIGIFGDLIGFIPSQQLKLQCKNISYKFFTKKNNIKEINNKKYIFNINNPLIFKIKIIKNKIYYNIKYFTKLKKSITFFKYAKINLLFLFSTKNKILKVKKQKINKFNKIINNKNNKKQTFLKKKY